MKPSKLSFRALVAVLCIFCLVSCQNSSNTLLAPSQDLTSAQQKNSPGTSNAQLWGFWHVSIDPDSNTVDIIPLRGVEFAANVNTFLEPGGKPKNNLGIKVIHGESDFPNGLVVVDVSLTHPLPYPQYSGFDVRGILIHNGTTLSKSDSSVTYGVTGNTNDAVLLNADGWTRWWNPQEFLTPGILGYKKGALSNFDKKPTAVINGYKCFADGLGATDNYREFVTKSENNKNRCWFTSGSTNTRRYRIQFPVGQPIKYDYCVFACWEEPDPAASGDPGKYEAGDFAISANCQEAFHLVVDTSGSNAYYVNPTTKGGKLNLKLEVFDWQAHLKGGSVNNEIAEIRIESRSSLINTANNTFVVQSSELPALNIGGSALSSTYNIDITNLNLTSSGDEQLLISVLSKAPSDYDSGFGAIFPGGAPLAAYTFAKVTIGNILPCPIPTVTKMTPNAAMINTSLNDALIEGMDFEYGPKLGVKLVSGSTQIIGTDIKNVTNQTLTADFNLMGAPANVYDVVVTNDCLTEGVGKDLFSIVTCITPTVTGITPNCLFQGSKVKGIIVSGSNFVPGASLAVKLIKGSNQVSATNVTFINANKLECDIDLGSLPPGLYNVEVTTGCNPLLKGTLNDGFKVDNTITAIPPYQDVAYDWTYDIRNSSTANVFESDDCDDSEYFPIGFNVRYYNIEFSHFMIDTDGGIRLSKSSSGGPGAGCDIQGCDDPYIRGMIVVWGEDIDYGCEILWETKGTAPNRTLTVQWVECPCYEGYSGYDGGSHTFSVTLFENANKVRFQYEHPDNETLGDPYWGAPAPIVKCSLKYPGYNQEYTPLFCSLNDWPDTCIDYKAYEGTLPNATIVPPPPCDYSSNLVNQGYNTAYECSASATKVYLGDDESSAQINIGFTFTYAGRNYTTVRINSNGIIFFGNYDSYPITLDCGETPSWYDPTDCIVANSADLDPEETAGGLVNPEIKYETRTVGTTQVFIAEWENVLNYPGYDPSQLNTFQIILFNSPSTTCDPIRVQWEKLYEKRDTLVQYNEGNFDIEVCLLDNGGQHTPGSIDIVGS